MFYSIFEACASIPFAISVINYCVDNSLIKLTPHLVPPDYCYYTYHWTISMVDGTVCAIALGCI